MKKQAKAQTNSNFPSAITLSIKSVARIGLLASLGINMACGDHTHSDSSLDVNNGVSIAETLYPSVVLLVMSLPEGQGICTGTFVSSSQLITAGHCVEGLNPAAPKLAWAKVDLVEGEEPKYSLGARSLSFTRHPSYDINFQNGVNGFDLAVVNFPENSAPAVSELASASPELGSTLAIVGYGNNRTYIKEGQMAGEGSGEKRFGVNRLDEKADGFLTFYGYPEAKEGLKPGVLVSSGSGDSGGPMFINEKLVGVTSGGGLGYTETNELVSVSNYVDLNTASSQEFLAANLAAGVMTNKESKESKK